MTLRLLLALLAGLCTTLAFPPFDAWFLAVLGPALLLVAIQGQGAKSASLSGFVFGLAHFLGGVWWVLISTHVYGGAPLVLAVILLLLLSAYLALFTALAAGVFAALAKGRSGLFLVLLWPACWLLGEFARDTVFHGFPWFSLGYVATAIPGLLNVAALIGVHGLSALLAAIAGLVACVALGQQRAGAVAGLLLIGVAVLVVPVPSHWTQPEGEAIEAVLVQGNIPQDQKWLAVNREPTMQLYQAMTEEAWPADLVIWPEVAIPAAYWRVQWFFDEMDELARARQSTIFAGVITQLDGKAYNTIYALGEDSGVYVKRHLVPFGEYIPAPDWVRPLFDVLHLPFPGISTGLDGQTSLSLDGRKIAMSICFEDVFPLEVRETARDSAFLVNVTNDAWFAGSAAPQQHLQIARLRAAESGRSLLRVANTGVSAVIGPDGELQQTLPWGQRGLLRTQVQGRSGETPYHRWGRMPLYVFVFAVLMLALLGRRRVRSGC